MEMVREWARSVAMTAVLCSMLLMIAPSRMKRHVALVLETVLLVTVLAPAWRWISAVREVPGGLSLEAFLPEKSDPAVFDRLRDAEARRQIEALIESAGFRLATISLPAEEIDRELAGLEITVQGKGDPEILRVLTKLLALYTGLPEDRVSIKGTEGGR